MTESYSPDVQQKISEAENALTATVASMRGQQTEQDNQPNEENHDAVSDSSNVQPQNNTEDPPRRKGADFVKVEDEEVRARINYLYQQQKSADEKNALLLKQNRELQETLESLTKDVSSIRTESYQKKVGDELQSLKHQYKEALNLGDFDRAAELNDTMMNIVAEQKLRDISEVKKTENRPKVQEQQLLDKRQVKDAQYVNFLSEERDGSGNYVRPYLHDWHPDNEKAANEAAKIASEYTKSGREAKLPDIMKELDRRMRPSAAIRSDSVMSSENNGGGHANRKSIDLNDQERTIARKMGISEKDWAAQKELLAKRRG